MTGANYLCYSLFFINLKRKLEEDPPPPPPCFDLSLIENIGMMINIKQNKNFIYLIKKSINKKLRNKQK